MLTFLDFFAGVGGFRRGMEMAGHKCLGHCEWDKFANMSYKEIHNPKEDEWFGTDIRDVRASELPRADVWCFGFPCQDISVAGKQFGFDGKRSSLFFTVTRLIRDTKEEDRPKYLFIENVKNLFSVNGGTDFLKLLIELDEIGYDAEWQLLNTKNFGLPQNRERVFVVGHLRRTSGRKVFPITGESINSIKELFKLNSNRHSSLMNSVLDVSGITPTLDCMQGGNRQPKVLLCGNVNPSGKGMNGQVYDSKGLSPTLTTNKGEGQKILVRPVLTPDRAKKQQNGRRFKNNGEPMFTLTAQDRHGVMLNDYRIRRLTPKECWRLQGWNDEDYEKASKVCSDSQLYKQAGNGVSIPVIYEIAKRLE
ncbi:MAG: DNA cytosine methyltransferase [Zhenhengia sp.]|uniref:DNA cytosine methyltransferase n=1 Tax=Zhenhengia sp. TaxID=2944208 RepID=UPI00399675F0